MKISARNQLPAKVVAITAGEATANVELDANGLRLVASITVEAVRELGLAGGLGGHGCGQGVRRDVGGRRLTARAAPDALPVGWAR